MTIREVVSSLEKERQEHLPSRFPCRAIMVKNIAQYCDLLSELKKISDIRVVQTAEIFTSFDVMPNYDKLKEPQYHDEWLILTGVSEYLRLFAKNEARNQRFASLWHFMSSNNSMGRIIIPLWGCESQWFDATIGLNSDERQQDYFYDCSDSSLPDQAINLLILSSEFERCTEELRLQGNLCLGLSEWFEYWENPVASADNFIILTRLSSRVSDTNGNISIHVISDRLAFIKENMPGAEVLTKSNCSSEMQSILFDYAVKAVELNSALLKILNVSSFSGIDIMGKWNVLSKGQREIVYLWLILHPDGTYLYHCFKLSKTIGEICDIIQHEIFKVRQTNPAWVDEYQRLSSVLSLVPDHRFYEELNNIPEYEIRLDYLSNGTKEERIYLLQMVGQWMRKDPAQVSNCEKLHSVYPELFAYLCYKVDAMDRNLADYMSRYKAYKLENTLPDDETIYFNHVDTTAYEYRFSTLSEYIDYDTVVLWIDALGIEWLSLLKWVVDSKCDASTKNSSISMASLPTETCFNNQWTSMQVPHQKLDKLDKLAHKGVIDEPDYYACIENQFAFISSISSYINSLLEQHHRVIITGDHGTSRLAARFFHVREGIAAPKDAEICSHGRYCILRKPLACVIPNMLVIKGTDGTEYGVFENYDHFKQSGFAAGGDDDNAIYGEVHGGATPEEMLVPVLVLDNNKEVPIIASLKNKTIKISMKRTKLVIDFNRPVSQLSIQIAGISAVTKRNNDGLQWEAVVVGLKQGDYNVSAIADNHVITIPTITVQPALSGGLGDLP